MQTVYENLASCISIFAPGFNITKEFIFTVTACGHVRECRCLPHSTTYSLLPCIMISEVIKVLETVLPELHF